RQVAPHRLVGSSADASFRSGARGRRRRDRAVARADRRVTAAILTINRRAFASLRMHRNYRLYFLGQAVSQSGTWIDKVAQAWLVLALTHSAFAVGVLAACQFVPFSVLGLMAGVIVDRLDTWRTVIVTQAIRMVIAATLAGVVLAGVVQVWMVYTLAVLTGIVLVLDAPSRQQLTFKMVGRDELPNAVNFNVLLPVLAGRTLDSGPGVFGLIAACFGAGALVGGLLSAALSRASWKAIVAGAGGLGLAELVLAPQHSLGPAVVLLFIAGVCFTLYTANSNAVLQLRAPDHLRGRVIGFYYFAFNGLAPLGGILTGWLAATGGTELAFGVAGTVTALVALTALPQLPRLRSEPA